MVPRFPARLPLLLLEVALLALIARASLFGALDSVVFYNAGVVNASDRFTYLPISVFVVTYVPKAPRGKR